MKSKLLVLVLVLLVGLSSCCKKPESPAQKVKSGCENDPVMTNAEIINETKVCESSGLDAEALHCGDDFKTTIIQCKPREKKE